MNFVCWIAEEEFNIVSNFRENINQQTCKEGKLRNSWITSSSQRASFTFLLVVKLGSYHCILIRLLLVRKELTPKHALLESSCTRSRKQRKNLALCKFFMVSHKSRIWKWIFCFLRYRQSQQTFYGRVCAYTKSFVSQASYINDNDPLNEDFNYIRRVIEKIMSLGPRSRSCRWENYALTLVVGFCCWATFKCRDVELFRGLSWIMKRS